LPACRKGRELTETLTWLSQYGTSLLERSAPPAHPHEADDASLPPELRADYRICELLGEGAFGRVWLAEDLHLGRMVALKTLRPHDAAERVALDALHNEARLLAGLHHPNIVAVYTWRQVGEDHYLVLQYVAGNSFARRLKQEGALGWQQAARYVADVAEALLEVHRRGVVHRDIKPANVLWDPQRDEAVLTDFGLSVRLADPAAVGGSPLYMAPETFEGRLSPAVDVYSLAATLFTLATGEEPFPANDLPELHRMARRGLPDPEPRCTRMPEALERLIRAGLAVAPERRPALAEFAATLRGDLNQLLSDSLLMPALRKGAPAPVELRLTVSRWQGGSYQLLAATLPEPTTTRDMKRVPPSPGRVTLRSGERVRICVGADREGYVTVLNVGPTGNLNLLYPEDISGGPQTPLPAGRELDICEVELTPPAGAERVVAVWSRAPLSLTELRSVTGTKAED
jgi:serine/threonine protein kinase